MCRRSTLEPLLLLVALLLAACDGLQPGPTYPTATPRRHVSATAPAPVIPTRFAAPTARTAMVEVATPTVVPAVVARTRLPLREGWTRIDPGGATECARGTTYSFWVRPGTSGRLVVYFQGGGGCWNAETCAEDSTYFEDYVGEDDNPAWQSGVFETDNPDNPFARDSFVFVPYCTGDVHMGNFVQTYTAEGIEPVSVRHKGFVNSNAAVQWAFDNFTVPDSVFVTGCSAGSIGSAFFAPYIMENYGGVRVTQLGDAEAFAFDHPLELQTDWRAHDNFAPWIPALSEIAPGEFTMARFYRAIAAHYPDNVFAQYTSAHDSVQQRYYFANTRSAMPAPWESALDASLDEIHTAATNFRSYVAEGAGHCITPTSRFYSDVTGGVAVKDWIAALADGRTVENVGR